jgi:hypothetical protein
MLTPPRRSILPATDHGEVQMESFANVLVGLMVAGFGILGLFLVAGAADSEMFIFGLGLAVFAVAFNFGQVKRHFDKRDAAHGAARGRTTHV